MAVARLPLMLGLQGEIRPAGSKASNSVALGTRHVWQCRDSSGRIEVLPERLLAMSANSLIEWADNTWNPVRGCSKVSPGCTHCYAEAFAERFRGVPGNAFNQGFDVRLEPWKLLEPFHWTSSKRVFVNSMSDLFHDEVPNQYIVAAFEVMAAPSFVKRRQIEAELHKQFWAVGILEQAA